MGCEAERREHPNASGVQVDHMARELYVTVKVSLADEPLFDSTVQEKIAEIDRITDQCDECDGQPCAEHQAVMESIHADLTALFLGMAQLTFDACEAE